MTVYVLRKLEWWHVVIWASTWLTVGAGLAHAIVHLDAVSVFLVGAGLALAWISSRMLVEEIEQAEDAVRGFRP